jgi:serine phosphatase RsbU (regulator of sigma subunit)
MRLLGFIILFSFLSSQGQTEDQWQVKIASFIEDVNLGSDSALYKGKALLIELDKAQADYKFKMRVNLSLGNYYRSKYQLPLALNYYQITEDIALENKDTVYAAYAKGSKGFIYNLSGQYDKALEVYLQNLALWKSRKNNPLVVTAYGNVCKTYANLKNWSVVWSYCKEAMAFVDSTKVKRDVEDVYYMAGTYYKEKSRENLDSALYYLSRSIEFSEMHKNVESLYKARIMYANVVKEKGDYSRAEYLCKDVYDTLFKRNIYPELQASSCNCIANSLIAQEKDSLGYDYMLRYQDIMNKLKSIRDADNLSTWELEHDIQSIAVQDSLRNQMQKQEIKLKEKASKEKHFLLNMALFIGGLLILFAVWFVVRSMRKQKLAFYQLAATNKDITDSIIYAQRIQNAFIPTEEEIADKFDDAFVLYKPKDIVAGDFYWLTENKGSTYLAVADCTGHGVPGAMVSVVCHNALEEAIERAELSDTGHILDKTREFVIDRFSKEDSAINDGMDIALIKAEYTEARDRCQIQFSGAQNPLLLVCDGKLELIKGNKQPIGAYQDMKSFDNHEFELKKGDLIYLFSDGFIDQFGGENGKKLKSKKFKEILLASSQESMKNQLNAINQALINWKGDFEQLDDICVIGIKI